MAIGRTFRMMLAGVVVLCGVVAAAAWQPPRNSPVRAALMDAMRPSVEREIGAPVVFNVVALNVEANWAFVSVRALRPGGQRIDWSRTRHARSMAAGMMSDSILALLSGEGQRWRIVEFAFGPTDVPWEAWIERHGVPRGVFEAAYAGQGAAPPPAPAPAPQDATPAPPAVPAGWKIWDYGDLTVSTPAAWQNLDSERAPLALGGASWSATFSDRPMDTGSGVMLVMSWNADEFIYSNALSDRQILGRGRQVFADIAGTRTFFRIKDRYNDAQGFDVVSAEKLSGGTFHIGCRAPAARWPSVQDVCEQVLGSLRLASAPPQATVPPVAQPPAQPKPPVAAVPKPQPPPEKDTREDAFRAFTLAMEKLEAFEKDKDADDLKAGIEAAQKAVELQPRTSDYWRILGYAYSLGASELQLADALAEEAYESAIALDPANTGARLLLANLLIRRESWAKALDQIEAAVSAKADLATSPVIADMTRMYLVDQLAERGLAFFGQFAARHPRAFAVKLGQAILLKETGRKAEAIALARQVAASPQAPQTDAEHARSLLKEMEQ